MKIFIGADHLGENAMNKIIEYLRINNIEVIPSKIANNSQDDYPDFAFEVGENVKTTDNLGILICGNGIGISIAANKVQGIRCARVLTKEDAYKCKNHNAANIIALSSEVDIELNKVITKTFIETPNATESRFLRRVDKISNYEGKNNEL